jgi:DNA-binding FrmR family transcriptional regulator
MQPTPALARRKVKRALRRRLLAASQGDSVPLDNIQQSVLARLRRIEGQVRGIQGMVSNGTDCRDILMQVKAVRSALKAANGLILKRYLLGCHRRALESPTSDDAMTKLEESMRLLSSYLDS